jgi:hypothetical protein
MDFNNLRCRVQTPLPSKTTENFGLGEELKR